MSRWREPLRHAKRVMTRMQQGLERQRYGSVWARQISAAEANRRIAGLIRGGYPLLVGRIGHTEGRIVGEALFRGGRYGRMTCKEAHAYSGIFPVIPSLLNQFAGLYAEAIGQADLLGFWQTSHQARLLHDRYPGVPLTSLGALDPYLDAQPWSQALEGLRVLVVHPFAATIAKQYHGQREALFRDSRVLPRFDLQVLAPPQTLAPATAGFASWLEAFDALETSVLSRAFDLALLGCGAYGLPLAARIKAHGRQAIHLGGSLQVLFGIRGRRWDQRPEFQALMTEAWVRPSSAETPESAGQVDGGCYW